MADYLIKALAYEGQVRAYALRSTDTVDEARLRHGTWPTASAALGRAISASTLIGAMLKGEEKITVKVEGGGPIGAILVDADAKGGVRGYVSNPAVHHELNEEGKLDVSRAVGTSGFLSVTKDLGMREHFTGQVPLISGELGEDFTHYLVTSEQIPSAIGVGVVVNPDHSILASGGFMIQVMPAASEETIVQMEQHISLMPPISKLIQRGRSPQQILHTVLGEENIKILDHTPVSFTCTCSKERFSRAIISLGSDEITDMIKDDGAEATCDFCKEVYHFDRHELIRLRLAAEGA